MAKIEQDLGDLFDSNNTGMMSSKYIMHKEKFIEVVSNLLTEREANHANKSTDPAW